MSDQAPSLKIGALVVCEGEIYRLIGIDPAGVRQPSAYLENPATGESSRVLLNTISPVEDGPNVACAAIGFPGPASRGSPSLTRRADLGGVVVTLLLDAHGSFTRFREAFPGASGDLERHLRIDYPELFDRSCWSLPFRAVLVRTQAATVLIDAGVGPPSGTFLPQRQALLPRALAQSGFQPDDIDLVFLTHLHVDHVGWTAVEEKPFFTKARYVVSAAEWDFISERAESREVFTSKLAPLARRGMIDRVDLAEAELVPGVVAFPTPGHTPGHMSVRLLGTRSEACVIGDAAVHPAQIHDVALAYIHEEDAAQAAMTRETLCESLAITGPVTVAGHFPGGLGHLVSGAGTSYGWEEV
jgi:glyoxylase-like metal-dependent hydrolase (beta-lactamase superfamily II)